MAKNRESSVSLQDKIADMTECSICAEVLSNPKILPCVHSFCLHCLENYGKNKKPGDQIICPICRNQFIVPEGGLCHLPNNFLIGKMVEIGKLVTPPATEAMCDLCPEGEEIAAKLYCIDCEQIICERCSISHKKAKFTQNHQVVELGSKMNAQNFNLRNSYCDHHPRELVKLYCYDDDVTMCVLCCVESHQSHRCVNIEKAAGEFTERLKQDLKKVENRLPEYDIVLNGLNTYRKEFTEQISKSEENIRDFGTKLKTLINEHTEILIENLKLVRDQSFKSLDITTQDVERFRVMIDSFSRYSEELLSQGSPVDICKSANQMHMRANELVKLPANCSGDRFHCESVAFHSSSVENLLKQCRSNNILGELTVTELPDRIMKFEIKRAVECESEVTEPFGGNFEESLRKESPAWDPCVIEVQGLPDNATDTVVTMLFENKRYCGIADVEVADVKMLEGDRALLTIKEPQHAKALVDRGSVTYKTHMLVISRPSKPKPTKEVRPSVQHPFTHEDVKGTPDEYATGHQQSVCESTTIDVSNIPRDMAEDTLRMIFESKRLGGGGEVTNIVYEKGQGSAVITLSDQEVAKRLVHQETVVFKRLRLMITRHAEVDRSHEPFHPRKLNNDRTDEKQQLSISDRTIKVSNIPSHATKKNLETIFKTRWNSGGAIDHIVYDQGEGTAEITFKNPKVAEALIDSGCLRHSMYGMPIGVDGLRVRDIKISRP